MATRLTHEKSLKKILAASNGGCDLVFAPALGISEKELRYLSAMGVIDLIPAGDNEFYARIAPDGLTYFDDKITDVRKWIMNNLIAILSFILALIAFVRTL